MFGSVGAIFRQECMVNGMSCEKSPIPISSQEVCIRRTTTTTTTRRLAVLLVVESRNFSTNAQYSTTLHWNERLGPPSRGSRVWTSSSSPHPASPRVFLELSLPVSWPRSTNSGMAKWCWHTAVTVMQARSPARSPDPFEHARETTSLPTS